MDGGDRVREGGGDRVDMTGRRGLTGRGLVSEGYGGGGGGVG